MGPGGSARGAVEDRRAIEFLLLDPLFPRSLISALVIQNLVGEGQVIGVGSALAVILLVVSLVPIILYLSRAFAKDPL